MLSALRSIDYAAQVIKIHQAPLIRVLKVSTKPLLLMLSALRSTDYAAQDIKIHQAPLILMLKVSKSIDSDTQGIKSMDSALQASNSLIANAPGMTIHCFACPRHQTPLILMLSALRSIDSAAQDIKIH